LPATALVAYEGADDHPRLLLNILYAVSFENPGPGRPGGAEQLLVQGQARDR
jgi:hypothetical protein